jgi:hypothetical protein
MSQSSSPYSVKMLFSSNTGRIDFGAAVESGDLFDLAEDVFADSNVVSVPPRVSLGVLICILGIFAVSTSFTGRD